jgi:hypothetical protein
MKPSAFKLRKEAAHYHLQEIRYFGGEWCGGCRHYISRPFGGRCTILLGKVSYFGICDNTTTKPTGSNEP